MSVTFVNESLVVYLSLKIAQELLLRAQWQGAFWESGQCEAMREENNLHGNHATDLCRSLHEVALELQHLFLLRRSVGYLKGGSDIGYEAPGGSYDVVSRCATWR